MNLDSPSKELLPLLQAAQGSSPEHQLQVKSYFNLTEKLELDAFLYFVDMLHAVTIQSTVPAVVPSYTRLDLRLGYRPVKQVELSIAGQNLFDKHHQEFYSRDVIASTIPRSIYAKMTWRF